MNHLHRTPLPRDLIVRRADVLATQSLWLAGSAELTGSQPAPVEVEWADGILAILLGGWLMIGDDCQVSIVWCSIVDELRATGEANSTVGGVVELIPCDQQAPRAGDHLLVRHVRHHPQYWEVLFILRF